MDGGIFMSKGEQFKYQIVSQFLNGKITRRESALLLQVRERSVARLARRVQAKGFLGATHAGRGRKAFNAIEEKISNRVMNLVKKKYYDFNMTHCLEILKKEHGIELSYSTFRRLCHKENMVKRKKKRRARIHCLRARMPSEGMLLQMDGSHHHWNRKEMTCLIAAIDDATSNIPHAEFFKYEGTLPCMAIVQRVVEKKGIPMAIYVDKAEWFGGRNKETVCQFKRACGELGIKIIFAHSPQAKGRIERVWNTMQDRLIPEMRLKKITTLPEMNQYLQNEFLPNYWEKTNTVSAGSPDVQYRPVPMGTELREIFCIKDYRRVNNDNTIRWKKKVYQIQTEGLKHSIARRRIEIRVYQDQTWKVFFAGRLMEAIPYGMNIKLAA